MATRTDRRAPRRPGRRGCKHPVRYETDWLGRTYAGCPVCGRWKLQKTEVARPDGKRLAA